MSPQDEARTAALEARLAHLEKRLALAQLGLVRKVTEALQALVAQETAQEAKVAASLRTLLAEMADVREQVAALMGPQTAH